MIRLHTHHDLLPVRADYDHDRRPGQLLRLAPGTMVKHMGDVTSRGTVVSNTCDGITVLWSRLSPDIREPAPPPLGSTLHQLLHDEFSRTPPADMQDIEARVRQNLDQAVSMGSLGKNYSFDVSVTHHISGRHDLEVRVHDPLASYFGMGWSGSGLGAGNIMPNHYESGNEIVVTVRI